MTDMKISVRITVSFPCTDHPPARIARQQFRQTLEQSGYRVEELASYEIADKREGFKVTCDVLRAPELVQALAATARVSLTDSINTLLTSCSSTPTP